MEDNDIDTTFDRLLEIPNITNWKLSLNNVANLNGEIQCPICHLEYQENTYLVTTNCPAGKHTFHYACFLECMHDRRRYFFYFKVFRCPICRNDSVIPVEFRMPDLREHFDFIGHLYRSQLNNSQNSQQNSQNSNLGVLNNQTLDTFLQIPIPNTNTQQIDENQQANPPLMRTNIMSFEDNNVASSLGDPLANFHISNTTTQVSFLFKY